MKNLLVFVFYNAGNQMWYQKKLPFMQYQQLPYFLEVNAATTSTEPKLTSKTGITY